MKRAMKPAALGASLGLMLLSGCYAHTDFVVVEPVRYVPPPPAPTPGSTFGWVPADAGKADGFKVRVGDLTYQRIIEPLKKDGEITREQAVSAFSAFAEIEVVRRQFCTAAFTPPEARQLVGSKTPPEMETYVRCTR